MADQTARLEAATVRAEVGSSILYRFSNDGVAEDPIPTASGDITNLKKIILEIQTDGAEKISFATQIYATTAAGIAATTNGAIFLVRSGDPDEIYAVYSNNSGTAVDTGKRALSATAIQTATDAASSAADAAQTAANTATARVAGFHSPSASDPTTRDDGSALQIGDTYFNTSSQSTMVYSNIGWVAQALDPTYLSANAGASRVGRAGGGTVQDFIGETASALSGKEPTIAPGSTAGTFWANDKTFKAVNKANVGLGNVDNTADASKPVSAPQQAALDLKASKVDLSSSTDTSKGAALIGYSGRTLKGRLDDEINIQDVWAKQGGGVSWADAMNIAISMASFNINTAQRSGARIKLPGGNDYDFSDIIVKSGIVIQGDGPKNTRVYCSKANGTIFKQSAADQASGEYKNIGFEGILFDGGTGTSGASQIASFAINASGMHHSYVKNCQMQRFNSKGMHDGDAFVVDFLVENMLAAQNSGFAFHFFNALSTCVTFRHTYAVGNNVNWRMENIGEAEWWGCKNEKSTVEGIGLYGPSGIARIFGGYSEDCALSGNRSQINVEGGASIGIRDHYMKYNASAGANLAHIVVNGGLRTMIEGVTFNSDPGASGFDIAGSSGSTRNIYRGANFHIGSMAPISDLAEARCYGTNYNIVRGPAAAIDFQSAAGVTNGKIVVSTADLMQFLSSTGVNLMNLKPAGAEFSGAWNGPHLNVGGFHIWAGSSNLRVKFGAPTSIDDGNKFTLS